jgi:hypothetical protein
MNDLSHIFVFMVPIVLIITIAIVIIASFNHRLKKQILESGRTDNDLLKVLSASSGNSTEVLKWGLIFFFGGIGLIVIYYIPYNSDSPTLPFGIEAVFVSIGFLAYYFATRKNQHKNLD